MRLNRPIQTRFRCGSTPEVLNLAAEGNSPVHYAKGTPSLVARPCGRAIELRQLVDTWFQVLLTQLVAVLFIVQSPYWFTIGHRGVFSLGQWSARFHTEFHELRATLVRLSKPISQFRIRDYHPLWSAFPDRSSIGFSAQDARNPGTNPGLGCSAFARRYLRSLG